MDAAPAEVYQSPPILFIFCLLSAMAVILGTVRWLWLIRKNDHESGKMWHSIALGQIYIFFGIIIFSIVATCFDKFYAGANVSLTKLVPEFAILCGAFLVFRLRFKREGLTVRKGVARELYNIFIWVFSGCLGWAFSVGLGYALYHIISFLSRNDFDFVLFTIMMVCASWAGAAVGSFFFLRQKYIQSKQLTGLSPQILLIPVAVSYLILMVPLAIQEVENSKALEKQKYEKIIRRI